MFSASVYCKRERAQGKRDILDQGDNNSMGSRLLTLCRLFTPSVMFNKALLITIALICTWEQTITLWAPDQSLYTASTSQGLH